MYAAMVYSTFSIFVFVSLREKKAGLIDGIIRNVLLPNKIKLKDFEKIFLLLIITQELLLQFILILNTPRDPQIYLFLLTLQNQFNWIESIEVSSCDFRIILEKSNWKRSASYNIYDSLQKKFKNIFWIVAPNLFKNLDESLQYEECNWTPLILLSWSKFDKWHLNYIYSQ